MLQQLRHPGCVIYLPSFKPTTDSVARLRRRIGLFLLAALFYIQANEGAGSRVMRDGMGEKQGREEESEPRNGEKL